MERGETRTGRRRSEAHDRIIESASALFIERGARAVSMDEIAERADIARRTLFNHFGTKDELLCAVASPILEDAIALAERRLAMDSITMDDILGLCLELFGRHGARLELLFAFELEDSPALEELHARYMRTFSLLVRKAAGEEESRLVGRLVYRVFVPLLRSLVGEPDLEERFRCGMRGLIEGALRRGAS